jgi:uncharacterized protein YggU (UPF0235/DUF167 family)
MVEWFMSQRFMSLGFVSLGFMSQREVIVAVRVRPRSSRTAVGGGHAGAHGPAIVVAVSEPAVDGRATRAALDALAKALGLGRDQVRLHTGARGRDKLFAIVNPPADVSERLRTLRDSGVA